MKAETASIIYKHSQSWVRAAMNWPVFPPLDFFFFSLC